MKILRALLLGLICATAPLQADVFSRSADSGALVWNKYPSSTRRIEWKGGTDARGYASGYGITLFFNRGLLHGAYFGRMEGGRMEGQVVAIYPVTAMCYIGQLRDWSEEGPGFMTFPDGTSYQGIWSNGEREGTGSMWDSSGGLIYEGAFHNDEAVGRPGLSRVAVRYEPSNSVYKKYRSSDLKWYGRVNGSGLAEGRGVVISRDNEGQVGGIYFCQAAAGRVQGEVAALYAKPRQAYIGSIVDWSEQGQGTMFYPDGRVYSGGWEAEQWSGIGALYSADGQIIAQGRFSQDQLIERFDPAARASPAMADGETEDDFVPSPAPGNDDAVIQAWQNIAMILLGQKAFDYMVDSDSDFVGAIFSCVSKTFARAPIVDDNLRIIFPDQPDVLIHLVRNILCSFCDGNLSPEDVLQRMGKTEFVAAARREGADEGQAARAAVLTYDILTKLSRIQANAN